MITNYASGMSRSRRALWACEERRGRLFVRPACQKAYSR
jgi:hypothetical protein